MRNWSSKRRRLLLLGPSFHLGICYIGHCKGFLERRNQQDNYAILREMTQALIATWLIVPALFISAVGILIWKKRRSYVKVGKISKLYFHPVKSLKAIEVKSGKCTEIGFEVNGLLDRIQGKIVSVVDCGDKAANFFRSFLKVSYVRLVRYIPPLPDVAFPDYAPYHILSQASVDDLNSKLEEQISENRFRPNILAENCTAFAEDSWKYIKFPGGVKLNTFILTTRCVFTTNNPSTGVITMKEPHVTLRKYRIPIDQTVFEKSERYQPCLGIYCGCIETGEICVGDDIYAQVGEKPEMKVK